MSSDLQVLYEATPNPNSMKFIVTKEIADETAHFAEAAAAERSPLAMKLFGFPWTAEVFIGPNFLTVTKQDWVEWETLAEPLSQLIKEHIESGLPVIHPEDTSEEDESDSPVVKQIKQLLNKEIRPAVAMDGGDIVFHKFEKGCVYLFMQGACSGCPSSTMTLKMGIEARMKELIPEVEEVVAM